MNQYSVYNNVSRFVRVVKSWAKALLYAFVTPKNSNLHSHFKISNCKITHHIEKFSSKISKKIDKLSFYNR